MFQALNSMRRRVSRLAGLALSLAVMGAAGTAFAADPAVTGYAVSPNPTANGEIATFRIAAANVTGLPVNGATLTIHAPANFAVDPADLPAGCTADAVDSRLLTCALPTLAVGAPIALEYRARAITPGVATSKVTITSPVADTGPLNNEREITATVQSAADLTVSKTDNLAPHHSIPGGAILTYTLKVTNNGPDIATGLTVTDNLPAATDLQFLSASGTGWTCPPPVGATLVCTYAGAAPVGDLPPIEVRGKVLAAGTDGTVTNNAFVRLTTAGMVDPRPTNDVAPPVVTRILPGADLEVDKSVQGSIQIKGDPAVIVGDDAVIRLTVRNHGPVAVGQATVTDDIAPHFQIGVLPPGCVQAGQVVTCQTGPLAAAGSRTFDIPVKALAETPGDAPALNTATVTGPADITDPVTANNTDQAAYRVVSPRGDLELVSKTKTPNPVKAGEEMTSTIRVRNTGWSTLSYDAVAAPLIVTDRLSPGEDFIASGNANWNCSAPPRALPADDQIVTCILNGSGALTVGQSPPNLVLRTMAADDTKDMVNVACTGATAGSGTTPADGNPGNDCADPVRAYSTTKVADLALEKWVSLSPDSGWDKTVIVPATADRFYIRLRVRNLNLPGGDTAHTVEVRDIANLPFFSSALGTGFNVVSVSHPLEASPYRNGSQIRWTLTDLAPGQSREAVIEIVRPVTTPAGSHAFNNVRARVSSPDTVDAVALNNEDRVSYLIEPIADVAVTNKDVTPNPVRVGVEARYTISVNNAGPNSAEGVRVTDNISPTLFEVTGVRVVGSKPGATCDNTPAALAAGEVRCDLGVLGRNEPWQIEVTTRPRLAFLSQTACLTPPGPDRCHTNTAAIATDTYERPADKVDNQRPLTHPVLPPRVDLLVEKDEPAGPGYDPAPFGQPLVYDVRVANLGVSRASDIIIYDRPAPPAGYTMALTSVVVAPVPAGSGLRLTPAARRAPVCGTPDAGGIIACRLNAADDLNYLDQGEQAILRLTFDVEPVAGAAPSMGSLTFWNHVEAKSAEERTDPAAEQEPLNNRANQDTTVPPGTDLAIEKTRVTPSPVGVNQPVEYRLVVRNLGPSPTSQARVTDQLPPGWERVTGREAVVAGAGASVSGVNCSGANTVLCVIDGYFPGDGTPVTLTLFARAAHPYAGSVPGTVTNEAVVAPGQDAGGNPISLDPNPANDKDTEDTALTNGSIAGVVRVDGAPRAGVTVTLTGTDASGAALPARTAVTGDDGTFVFNGLPPGDYRLVTTQPAGALDHDEVAGGNGGSVSANYSSDPEDKRISDIPLGAGDAATGYVFNNLTPARISGYIYRDDNNNGLREPGEAGFAPAAFDSTPHVRLTGTDYAGNPVDRVAVVDGDGRYEFADAPPSNADGYRVIQRVQPRNTVDGLDANGPGAVIPGSAGRAAPEFIAIGVVASGADLRERNFGELSTSRLGGMVFLDADADAARGPGETSGLRGAVVRLTGTNDLGQAVDCQVTTGPSGLYSFPPSNGAAAACPVLRPGTYALTVTPAPGFTHTGAFIGSLGGTSGGVSGVDRPAPGAPNTTVTTIVVNAGAEGHDYDFGGTGQGLSGYVYIDLNRSGVRDGRGAGVTRRARAAGAEAEPGIAGVTMTLSGQTAADQDVCELIACTAVTDADGGFFFVTVPGSNAAGYTLTQQSQSSPPLSKFADGLEAAGQVAGVTQGVAGDDVISGIVMAAGQLGLNYAFGEWTGSLSGSVYVDANDDGVRQAGETGVPGTTVTLSGTTIDGEDICAWRAALDPAQNCDAVTDADGRYVFTGLPAGVYTLIEAQPGDYADGRETAGSAGGTVNNGVFDPTPAANTIASIALGAGVDGLDYGFGERGAAINGRVFKDPQRDGVDGGGEPPIPGVTVELIRGGVVIATATTDADGRYEFPNLPAGDYTVREVQPAGYGSSSPDERSVNVSPGVVQAIDFADTVSSLAGHVFVDTNNDGVRQPGEAPIEGVTVRLTGTDAAGASVSRTAVTDATGAYVFDDLLSGTYALTEVQPEGYADGQDTAGSHGGVVDSAADRIGDIALPAGTDAVDYAFGERGQSLSGHVYVDLDLNGVKGPDDRPLEGVTIELRKPSGELVATTVTGPDGGYSFGDIRGGDYVIVEIQPAGYGDGPENPSNRVAVSIGAEATPAVNFGERVGSLSGLVYNDSNNNGRRDPDEPAIPGVLLTLTGADAGGRSQTRTAVSGPDGTYRFADVPGGTFTVTETQPDGYQDGLDTPGDAGGTSDGGDAIVGIAMPAAFDAKGYLFGERGAEAQISGSVWLDADHDRARGGGEPAQADWIVELLLGDRVIAATTTGADGGYAFTSVAPGAGYGVRFRHPRNNAVYAGARPNERGADFVPGVVSDANPGGARLIDRELTGLTLKPGARVPEQSLPLDPWGVVYDSVRRTAVPGAAVEIAGPAGFDPALHLLGGAGNLRQVTDALGLYQFQLTGAAPAGVYTLTVTPPNGSYNPLQPSSIIPPCAGPLAVNGTPDPLRVSTIGGPPPTGTADGCVTGIATTGYVLSLSLTPGVSAAVVNNNLPIDPILEGAIEVTKTTPMVNVTRGGLVPYVITARNTLAGAVPGVTLTDRVPAGFRYRADSARVDGVAMEPVEMGRTLSWPGLTFAAGQTRRVEMILVVGSGVTDGEHTNVAFAVNPLVDQVISNRAEATVRLTPDPDFDCTDILGKAFDDLNGNGVQDEGEPGLPAVRLVTARGLIVTTDAEGRYHITCPMIPNESRGSNFVVRLDERSLPTGYRMTTDNPDTVRLTRGKFARLNFGASLHRVVRLDVNGDAFDGEALRPEFAARLPELVAALAQGPSILRLTYGARGEADGLIARRIAEARRRIADLWNDEAGRYRLVVEEETVQVAAVQAGGAS